MGIDDQEWTYLNMNFMGMWKKWNIVVKIWWKRNKGKNLNWEHCMIVTHLKISLTFYQFFQKKYLYIDISYNWKWIPRLIKLFFQAITTVASMSFSVTGSSTTIAGSLVETNCATDWLTIPCATNTMDPNVQSGTPPICVDRICGMVFNSVTAQSGSTPASITSKFEQIFVSF